MTGRESRDHLQPRADKRNLFERVYAVVPAMGAGTLADPVRPMYAPTDEEMKKGDRSGVIAFHFEMSDNGKFALVEFVLGDRNGLAGLRGRLNSAKAAGGDFFDRENNSRADIDKVFKAHKKDFDFSKFQVVVP